MRPGGWPQGEKGGAEIAGIGRIATPKLVRIVFVSRASRPLAADEIEDIARRSAHNNRARGITGLLVHQPPHFGAVLEGSRSKVFARMEVIIADDRHGALRILDEADIASARFESWTFSDLPPSRGSDDLQPVVSFVASLVERLR